MSHSFAHAALTVAFSGIFLDGGSATRQNLAMYTDVSKAEVDIHSTTTQCVVPCQNEAQLHAKQVGECGADKFIIPGRSVTYRCVVGYGVNHDPLKKTFKQDCQDSGQLTAISACSIVHCKDTPQVPGNAHRVTAQAANQTYAANQVVEFTCNSYEGDYEARKLQNPGLQEVGKELLPSYTYITKNGKSNEQLEVVCGADGKWKCTSCKDSYEKLLADGGCHRWKTGTAGPCTGTCGEQGKRVWPVSCEPPTATCDATIKPFSETLCVVHEGCELKLQSNSVNHAVHWLLVLPFMKVLM